MTHGRLSLRTVATRWGLLAVLLVVVAGFSLWVPESFPTSGNLHDILASQPPGIFVAYAAMLVLVVGEFDLSIGATLGISQFLVLELITSFGLSWGVSVAVVLALGLLIGLVNAMLVVGLGMNSFIATIGVSTILVGLLEWVSNGNAPIFSGAPRGLTRIAQTTVGGIALPVVYALAASVILWVVLEYTVFGRQLRATGANRVAAGLSGIRTDRARVVAFAAAGFLASIGGILVTARIGAADATSGGGYLLPAYAAAFLGATAVRPGFFNVWGTLIAIALVAVGITGLQLKGVDPWVTPLFNGGALLLAVAISSGRPNRRLLSVPHGLARRRARRPRAR